MKKFLLFICAIFAFSISALAAPPLKTASGDVAVLKESGSKATWKVDCTGAKFDNEQNFKTWSGSEYNSRVSAMNKAFGESFNKYSKGLELVKSGSAKYNITVKITNFERKINLGMPGSAAMELTGTVTVTQKGKKVLEININGLAGQYDFVENDRFTKAMDMLCKGLCRMRK